MLHRSGPLPYSLIDTLVVRLEAHGESIRMVLWKGEYEILYSMLMDTLGEDNVRVYMD